MMQMRRECPLSSVSVMVSSSFTQAVMFLVSNSCAFSKHMVLNWLYSCWTRGIALRHNQHFTRRGGDHLEATAFSCQEMLSLQPIPRAYLPNRHRILLAALRQSHSFNVDDLLAVMNHFSGADISNRSCAVVIIMALMLGMILSCRMSVGQSDHMPRHDLCDNRQYFNVSTGYRSLGS